MDEAREAREEQAALERDEADEQRQARESRRYWTDCDGLEWAEHVAAETARWSR